MRAYQVRSMAGTVAGTATETATEMATGMENRWPNSAIRIVVQSVTHSADGDRLELVRSNRIGRGL